MVYIMKAIHWIQSYKMKSQQIEEICTGFEL
jgi:hypothetical protein